MVNLYVVIPGEYNKNTFALTQKGFEQANKMGRILNTFVNKGETLIITGHSASCQQTAVLMYADLKSNCKIIPYSRQIPKEKKSLNAFIRWAVKSGEFTNIVFVTDKPNDIEFVSKFYDFDKPMEAKIIHFTYGNYTKSFTHNGIINN
ncbi:MAG: hypothetical protein IKV94_00580 [Clostridia bacterium]|nr:hypothetical protein [Clostridia bacterium]